MHFVERVVLGGGGSDAEQSAEQARTDSAMKGSLLWAPVFPVYAPVVLPAHSGAPEIEGDLSTVGGGLASWTCHRFVKDADTVSDSPTIDMSLGYNQVCAGARGRS